jgi:hypothetical protein
VRDHRCELVCVVVRLRHLGGEDHLLGAGEDLGVVALHRLAARPLHQPRVRVGRVDPPLGERGRIGPGRLATGQPAPVRLLPGGSPGEIGLIGGLLVGLRPLELLLAAA